MEGIDGASSISALETSGDDLVARLARLFLEHPAWIEAAAYLRDDAASEVWFSHRPGEPWRLVRREGRTRLLPGRAASPDLVFRFPPGAIERLAGVRGGVGAFAVTLFGLMEEPDPDLRVEFRILASFGRLLRRGYVRLLLLAGPEVARFGAERGVSSLLALRRRIRAARRRAPAPWEGA